MDLPSDAPKLRSRIQALLVAAGGEAGLERILVDFYARMARDVMLGFFFDGRDTRQIALRQRDFLLRAMGARPSYAYAGKAPAQAHEELAPILPGHFDRRLRLLEEVLREHGLTLEDIRTWVEFEESFRAGIVTG